MMVKFKLIALVLGALFFYGCKAAQDSESPDHKFGGVVTEHNTALRISPLVFSGVVARLDKGRTVEVTNRSAEKSRIARTTDYWYHVKLQDGITGWIYGQNLRLMDIKNYKQINNLISEFKEFEAGGFSKTVAGKWWSVNAFNDFTEHVLELYEDNRYKSYYKWQQKNPIEGEFRVDFNKNDIIFPKGTTFKQNLKFAERGESYILYTQSTEKEMSFKKIQEGTEENMLEQQQELQRRQQEESLEPVYTEAEENTPKRQQKDNENQ